MQAYAHQFQTTCSFSSSPPTHFWFLAMLIFCWLLRNFKNYQIIAYIFSMFQQTLLA